MKLIQKCGGTIIYVARHISKISKQLINFVGASAPNAPLFCHPWICDLTLENPPCMHFPGFQEKHRFEIFNVFP